MAERAVKGKARRANSSELEPRDPLSSPAISDSNIQENGPPRKKTKLTMKGPKPPAPVKKMPKRERNPPSKYQQDAMPPPPKSKRRRSSPAPSSNLSPRSSPPGSSAGDEDESREESPFNDVPETSIVEDYGDFASFYITGGDEPNEATKPTKPTKTAKAAPNGEKRKRASTSSKEPAQTDTPKQVGRPKKGTKPPSLRRSSSSGKAIAPATAPSPDVPNVQQPMPMPMPMPVPGPRPQPPQLPSQGPVPPHHQSSQPARPLPGHPPQGPPAYPQGHPPPGPQRAPPPAPVIRFIEVPFDPKPTEPDTVAVMIAKLESLSATLKQFGGVPTGSVTPPRDSKSAVKPPSKKTKARSRANIEPGEKEEQLDSFLGLFDGDDDDESEDSEASPIPIDVDEPESEAKDFNYVLPNPGTPDAPLVFGIQFIQNALKSWAQQRMTHQIMTQWNDEQSRGCFLPQHNRGRGRPKKYEAPPGGPPPVIEMNLVNTPEGLAIREFQRVLDSGCLQVNTHLPVELARALRLLYMQIDNLINQGRTDEKGPWHCMSYGAQFAAHQARLAHFKETEARLQQKAALMHQQHHQQVMAQMGLNPQTTPMTAEEAQHHHAMELERRRNAQHAQQQPYISSLHLNPLPLGSHPPTPQQNGPSPSPAPGQQASPVSTSIAMKAEDGGPLDSNSAPQKNHLEKVKMYMPFLPRSGNTMKFSFAPQKPEALETFGPGAFPQQGPSPQQQIPNRGPMMDVPRPHSSTPAFPTPMSDTANSNAVRSPSASNTREDAIDLTSSDGPQPGQASTRPATSNGHVSGFVPINKPSSPAATRPRRQSVPTEKVLDTIRVATATSSSRKNSISSGGKGFQKRKNRGSAGSFSHPSAVVVDE
ncbi:hypothetical protein CERZMDRAFT_84795 [Cercospora zeae-maydis SCOH1-5]|uniref:Uncharacterized protein n=1 Tax=Cercospora zeae-maydis SCOH1-5 TaxID=717836 RepID=A0A6A6FGF5_9PEZI|nr:hypothetical protein CERZMDRAFT_84795 [Cercospora zeae-maydis SCOH1-5]